MTDPRAPKTILTVDRLDVTFKGRRRQKVKAVVDVSFAVAEGETFGVIGESGSGKSTLGRAVVCLLKPSAGTILHYGEDPFQLSASELRQHRRSFQIVFQDPHAALDPRMTILESVREPLDVARLGTSSERQRKALAMLDRVALSEELAQRYPHEISGGQKQRANIARALVLEPRLIVCDEVVAALDVSIQADMLNLFADLQREFGLTYLFISHDLRVVAHISDRVAVMYAGQLVELAPAEPLMNAPLHPYTQALLSAEPEPRVPENGVRKRIILKGEIPSPLAPPPGCRFHTRCPIAAPQCASIEPAWQEFAPGRFVACHFAGTQLTSARETAHQAPNQLTDNPDTVAKELTDHANLGGRHERIRPEIGGHARPS
jgi:oligopeptide/dipeptide ABC transporter ATP-binding protein